MTTQTEAHDLIRELEDEAQDNPDDYRWKAATELRRLEAANAELLEALQKISAIELQMYSPDWEEINMAKGIADAAIKKHGGQS